MYSNIRILSENTRILSEKRVIFSFFTSFLTSSVGTTHLSLVIILLHLQCHPMGNLAKYPLGVFSMILLMILVFYTRQISQVLAHDSLSSYW